MTKRIGGRVGKSSSRGFIIEKRVRLLIEQQLEQLIELLDAMDGDTDLEDDELDGDPLDQGEYNALSEPALIYGDDQSAAPIATGPVCLFPRFGTA